MNRYFLMAAVCAGLGACSSVGTQFSKMDEPAAGERARVRVAANMLVKGVPESACVDWRKPGAGTIFGGIVGSSGYRGRSIGMPDPNQLTGRHSGEFYAAGGKPLTVSLINTPESRMRCTISITFVPQTGRDYEITMGTAIQRQGFGKPDKSACSASVADITGGQSKPVPTQLAPRCR